MTGGNGTEEKVLIIPYALCEKIKPESKMNRQQELEMMGWKRQFTADEPRLSEAVEEYQELGFEVLLEPLNPLEMSGECTSCLSACGDRYKTIYTRRKK